MPPKSSRSLKNFYKQKKPTVPKSKSNSKKKESLLLAAANLADEYDEHETLLRQFDMNMAYGPCLNMTRLARWERANSLGLNPPKDVEELLRSSKVSMECLWKFLVGS